MCVTCDYCGREAELVDSAEVYHGRSYGLIWLCRPCWAWVGVHESSKNHAPLGRLANSELRGWKIRAHAAFDPIWRARFMAGDGKTKARAEAYKWLAAQLEIPPRNCHIGMFDVELCKRAVDVCEAFTNQSKWLSSLATTATKTDGTSHT